MRFLVADKAPGQSVHHRGHCRVCTSTDFLKFLSRTRTEGFVEIAFKTTGLRHKVCLNVNEDVIVAMVIAI